MPAAAQSPEAAAAKRFRAAAKPILADHKAEIGASVAAIVATLDAFGDDIESGGFGAPLLEQLRTSLDAQSEAVYDAIIQTTSSGAGAAVTLMQELNGDDPNDGVFAATFYAGSGGAYDDFVAAVLATNARAYKKVAKASAALVKRAAASGVGLTVVIPPPAPAHNFRKAPNEEITSASGGSPPTIDFVVAGSQLSQEADGIFIVGGHADQGDAVPVTVSLFANLGAVTVDVTSAPIAVIDRRWSTLIDDGGAGLLEGNYLLFLRKGTTLLLDTVVGVR